jgi:hypothetical protein
MNRFACTLAVAVLVSMVTAAEASAQAQAAAPTTPAPAAPAKFIPPVKGVANIEVARTGTKRVGQELVTTLKIKNTSSGSINLLKVEEFWYDNKSALVSSGTERYRKPFAPGEVIEMQVKSPVMPGADRSNISFSHANGAIKAKAVKTLE